MTTNNKRSLARLLTVVIACVSLMACVSDQKQVSGVVTDNSEGQIKLDLSSTHRANIVFTCEPAVCRAARQFGVGDAVLLHLETQNGNKKLMAIRRCKENDRECGTVSSEQEEKRRKDQEQIDGWLSKVSRCKNKMKADMRSDSRYVEDRSEDFSDQQQDEILDRYNSLFADPATQQCLEKVQDEHMQAVLESCEKNGCGENVGGGCSHIVGYSISTSVLDYAVEKCGT